MAKVTGIGGVFFKSTGDNAALAAWYQKHLGMPLEAASKDHAGCRYHAKLGLVSEEHADVLRKLRAYCDS